MVQCKDLAPIPAAEHAYLLNTELQRQIENNGAHPERRSPLADPNSGWRPTAESSPELSTASESRHSLFFAVPS
jgi:hypothetical protein